MSSSDPTARSYRHAPAEVSRKKFVIGGIICKVYGLDELLPQTERISCIWLLNPRLATQDSMAPLASNLVSSWSSGLKLKSDLIAYEGLIAVTFDQRNHGTRKVDNQANQAWREGNPRHAQDMFSIYHGTQLDCSQLIDYLPSYIFEHAGSARKRRTISSHMALGVSLGGHCVWQCLLHEPRITTGVVVIGCPDYLSLMMDRAKLSNLQTWTGTEPSGKSFVGSADFPPALVQAIEANDPAGRFIRSTAARGSEDWHRDLSRLDKGKVQLEIEKMLKGKRILNLAGADDKLVPYARGEPFLKWFKGVIGPGGWGESADVVLEDRVFDGVGHAMSPSMVEESIRFVEESLEMHSHPINRSKM